MLLRVEMNASSGRWVGIRVRAGHVASPHLPECPTSLFIDNASQSRVARSSRRNGCGLTPPLSRAAMN